MADGSSYGQQNPWQLEKSTYKREAHPLIVIPVQAGIYFPCHCERTAGSRGNLNLTTSIFKKYFYTSVLIRPSLQVSEVV
jgi:hypothetical protein